MSKEIYKTRKKLIKSLNKNQLGLLFDYEVAKLELKIDGALESMSVKRLIW